MEVKISAMTDKDFISLLAHFSKESISSLENNQGYRSALYSRYIEQALTLRAVDPLELNDVDLGRGIVYIT